MTIHAVEDQPALRFRPVPLHDGAVDLVAQHQAREGGAERGAQRPPAGHDLAHVLLAPQPEGEAAPAASRGDPRHHTVPLGPVAQLHAGNGGVGDGLLAQGRTGGKAGRRGAPPPPPPPRRAPAPPHRPSPLPPSRPPPPPPPLGPPPPPPS